MFVFQEIPVSFLYHMELFFIILFLVVIAFLLSVRTLYVELQKSDKLKEVESELARGRVVFQASHHSSASDSSDA